MLNSGLILGQSSITMPNIVPPSPTAAALVRYGEIPVDFSTGVPRIDIPIFTIKTGKLELPLSISYHASGIKANDISTTVGLGWVLNAGGVIAGSVIGGRDEYLPKKFKSKAEINTAIQNAVTEGDKRSLGLELDNLIKNYFDTQADRYSYNFNGHAGIFRSNFLALLNPQYNRTLNSRLIRVK